MRLAFALLAGVVVACSSSSDTTPTTTGTTTAGGHGGHGGQAGAGGHAAAGAGAAGGALPDAGTTLPGGRPNYVVALGKLVSNLTDNEVRIGTYVFDGQSGRVNARMYAWFQSSPVPRVEISTVPDASCTTATGVHSCRMMIPQGFSGDPNDVRSGSFSLADASGLGALEIVWDDANVGTEHWTASLHSDGSYAMLELVDATVANHGYAYGSLASLDTRRAMDSVHAHSGSLRFEIYKLEKGQALPVVNSAWHMDLYTLCQQTTWMMTYYQPSAPPSDPTPPCQSGCSSSNTDTSIEYYISRVGTDRRDGYWHWCTCLSQGAECYPGNSHTYPLLQILDDAAQYRGWVGVQAAFDPYGNPPPPTGHMLSVLRVYEP